MNFNKNDKEDLISNETAKLAKEKGFDWIVDYLYSPTEREEPISCTDNWNKYKNSYSLPTQSLLQKWLRKIGDIYVSINTITEFRTYSDDPGDDEYIPVHKFRIIKNIDNYKYDVIEWSGSYESYEEALEKGLQEGLKLYHVKN